MPMFWGNCTVNIVFVFDGLQVGGIERIGVDYVNLLADRGYNVSVVNVTPSLKDFYAQLPNSCNIYEINIPRKMVPYRYAKGAEKGILGALAYVIIGSFLTAINVVRKQVAKIRLKSLKESDVVIAFSGHFSDLLFVATDYLHGKKIAWLHGSEFEYKIISDGYFSLYRKIKNLVCLSELCDITCKKFNDENGINKIKIYNPILIDKKTIDANKVEELKSKFGRFILMVGRLAQDKDQMTVIKALKYLNEKRNEKIHLLLVGDGCTRTFLEKFVVDCKINEYVHFMGNCFDVQNYYSAAFVFVHSSPLEGLPTVLLEALTYEVPIAATDSIPGVREILKNNEYGLISPVGDWKQLGNNIEKLYSDYELRKKFQINGREMLKQFTPEVAVKKLEAFIKNIV